MSDGSRSLFSFMGKGIPLRWVSRRRKSSSHGLPLKAPLEGRIDSVRSFVCHASHHVSLEPAHIGIKPANMFTGEGVYLQFSDHITLEY